MRRSNSVLPGIIRLASAIALLAACTTSSSTGVDATLHPAPPTSGPMADLARGILAEVNRVRTDPQGYAASLEALLPYYDGTVLRRPGEAAIQTAEGRPAAEEAIRVLRAQAPLPALTWSDALAHAAYDHVLDTGPRGTVGHIGSDGSTPTDRMSRYGTWLGYASENIDYGPSKAVLVVQDFVIDDAVSDRVHRRNILEGSLRVAGAACGPHVKWGTMCVVDHAAGYIPR